MYVSWAASDPRCRFCRLPEDMWPCIAVLLLLSACTCSVQAHPGPVYRNYTFNNSKDTFELCKVESALKREVSLDELLPILELPKEVTSKRTHTLVQLIDLIHNVQPDVSVVFAPMLYGDADLAGVLSPGIPRLIHFTVRDKNSLVPHQVISIASWAKFNPGYSIMLFDDADIRLFMTTYFPDLLPTFDGLSSEVERTDMWRYLVLCIFGGVYADSDVVAAKPIDDWDQEAGLLTGIENVFTSLEAAQKRDYTRTVQMVQWVISAHRGHPVVCRMGEYVRRHVANEAAGIIHYADRDHAILERTGPGIWSSSVADYLNEHGKTLEDVVMGARVGDVRILPQTVFGCASSTYNLVDGVPYIYHMFKGSWRISSPNKVFMFLHGLYSRMFGPSQEAASQSSIHASPGVNATAAAALQQSSMQQGAGQHGQAASVVGGDVPVTGSSSSSQVQQRLVAGKKGAGVTTQGEARKLRATAAHAVLGMQPVSGNRFPEDVLRHDIEPAGFLHAMPAASVVFVIGLVCAVFMQTGSAARFKRALGSSAGLLPLAQGKGHQRSLSRDVHHDACVTTSPLVTGKGHQRSLSRDVLQQQPSGSSHFFSNLRRSTGSGCNLQPR